MVQFVRFIGRHVLNLVGMIALAFMFCMNAIAIASYMGITSGTLPGLGTYEITRMGDIPEWLVFMNIILTIYIYTVVVGWCARGPVEKVRAQLMEKMDKVRGELADEEKRCERAIAGHNDTIRTLRALQEKFGALQSVQDLPATAEATVEKMTELLSGWVDRMAYASDQLTGADDAVKTASTSLQAHVAGLEELFAQIEGRARTVVGALGGEESATATLCTPPADENLVVKVPDEKARIQLHVCVGLLARRKDDDDGLEGYEDEIIDLLVRVAGSLKSGDVSYSRAVPAIWALGRVLYECADNAGGEGGELVSWAEALAPWLAEV